MPDRVRGHVSRRNRFKDKLLNAASDIVSSWPSLLAILFLFAYATNSLYYFERDVLLAWAIATPLLQWLAVWAGRTALRRRALRPHLRSSAIIVQGRLQDMNGVPVVGILETPFTGTNDLTKRISDIVLASIILVLITPLLLIIAVGDKLSSPGPAIFRQKPNGLYRGEMTVYMCRSMRTMNNGPTMAQATKDYPRITPFGAFLRCTSLNELPQFFNVLQGSMSIVGPRPHAIAHNEMYREIIKAYMVRHKVKPGITGWAQANGLRGKTDTVEKMKARVEYDLGYLHNRSLTLDLQIIVRTVQVLFFDRNAY